MGGNSKVGQKERLLFLGLLNKGGKLVVGPSLKKEKRPLSLVIESEGPSSSERLRFRKKVERENIPYLKETITEEELGAALGMSPLAFVGILDKKAAKAYFTK